MNGNRGNRNRKAAPSVNSIFKMEKPSREIADLSYQLTEKILAIDDTVDRLAHLCTVITALFVFGADIKSDRTTTLISVNAKLIDGDYIDGAMMEIKK